MKDFDYLTEKSRMCNRYWGNDCHGCGLLTANSEIYRDCQDVERDDPKEARSIVKSWSEENPMETNLDHLEKYIEREFGLTIKSLIGLSEERIMNLDKDDFWKSEYKGAKDESNS